MKWFMPSFSPDSQLDWVNKKHRVTWWKSPLSTESTILPHLQNHIYEDSVNQFMYNKLWHDQIYIYIYSWGDISKTSLYYVDEVTSRVFISMICWGPHRPCLSRSCEAGISCWRNQYHLQCANTCAREGLKDWSIKIHFMLSMKELMGMNSCQIWFDA